MELRYVDVDFYKEAIGFLKKKIEKRVKQSVIWLQQSRKKLKIKIKTRINKEILVWQRWDWLMGPMATYELSILRNIFLWVNNYY